MSEQSHPLDEAASSSSQDAISSSTTSDPQLELRPPSAQRTAPIIYVIATLVAVNLILTAFLLARGSASLPSSSTAQPPLPTSLTSAERQRLFEEIKSGVNTHDLDALYMILDPVARVQVSKDQFKTDFQKIAKWFGTIEDGAYSHYVFLGSQDGQNGYQLVYQVRLSGLQFKTSTLLINLTGTATEHHVLGFRINVS